MKKNGGSIVNLASINGFVGYNKGISSKLKGINPYPHSKGGVIQLTKDMAVGFAELNIRVNALCPGYSKTNLTKMLWEDEKIEEYKEDIKSTCYKNPSEYEFLIDIQIGKEW